MCVCVGVVGVEHCVGRLDTLNSHTDLCDGATVASHVKAPQHTFWKIRMVSLLKSL